MAAPQWRVIPSALGLGKRSGRGYMNSGRRRHGRHGWRKEIVVALYDFMETWKRERYRER
jgi:hypothetical protein